MSLGETLKQKRITLNLTQEEVGEKLYVTRQTISNWENSKTLPDIDNLIDIATFYNLSLDTIFLKGSDVVKDIKRKEKITRLQKWVIAPWLTTILLLFLMYRAILEDNMINLFTIGCLLFLNAAISFFFESQTNEAKGMGLIKITKKRVIICAIIVLIGAISGFLSSYFNIFNI